MKKNILVLFGGASTEHEVSCISASNVINNLDREKYQVYPMGITKTGAMFLYNGSVANIENASWSNDTPNLGPAVISPCSVHHGLIVLDKAKKMYDILKIDVAFPVLHGKNGEDGTIQGLFTLAGIPFVGCSTYSSAVCMDKAAAKAICENDGIKVTPYITVRKTDNLDLNAAALKAEEAFGYPVFVKPANAGSSVGVSKAKNRSDLIEGMKNAFVHDKKILIEKAMAGKEIEVAVLGNENVFVSMCGEVEPHSEFYDYETKYLNGKADLHFPARIPDHVAEKVRTVAAKIYQSLDCTGFSRVDFFVNGDDVVFNEINTIPGFTEVASMYPKLMKLEGHTFSKLVDELISLAEEAVR